MRPGAEIALLGAKVQRTTLESSVNLQSCVQRVGSYFLMPRLKDQPILIVNILRATTPSDPDLRRIQRYPKLKG